MRGKTVPIPFVGGPCGGETIAIHVPLPQEVRIEFPVTDPALLAARRRAGVGGVTRYSRYVRETVPGGPGNLPFDRYVYIGEGDRV